MARRIDISGPAEEVGRILQEARDLQGVFDMTLLKDVGVDPPSDVLTLQTTNAGCGRVMRLIDRVGMDKLDSVATSEPHSVLSRTDQRGIENETNEAVWEETASLLRRDTNPSANFLALMTLSGAIAASGLWTDTLHIVVGAMLIAPGFEPLARMPFALVAGPASAALRGAGSTILGYLALAVGAALAWLVLQALDPAASPEPSTRQWVQYWSKLEVPGIVTGILAGAGGAFILTSRRTVFAAGVMVALALVPSMAVVALGALAGDAALALDALLRWGVDAALVILSATLVVGAKQALKHRRRCVG